MVDKINNILLNIYQDIKHPNSYGSVKGLLKHAQKILPTISENDVINFLKDQKSYTLHKLTRNNFVRRRIVAPKPGIIASADLADMSSLSRYNNGYKYILVFIDVFSRLAQAVPLKTKDANTVYEGLKKILNSTYFNNLKRLNTDEGKEFYNQKVNKLLTAKGITLYSVSSREIKASIAERFIRTMKGKLYRYMTHQNTKKYIDVIPDVIHSYNNTQHRGLGGKHTPNEIHQLKDEHEIRKQFTKMYKKPTSSQKPVIPTLDIGQYVRLSEIKPTFKKGYTIQNTVEIFKIIRVDTSQTPTAYYIEDLEGEPIKGIFYREELIPVSIPQFYDIEIIKTKKIAGRKKFLVKWMGYPDKFNSWIDETQLKPV